MRQQGLTGPALPGLQSAPLTALRFLDGLSVHRSIGALSGAPTESQKHDCIDQSILKSALSAGAWPPNADFPCWW